MTRTEELLALAENTIKAESIRPKGKSILSVRLIEPETIKQLVELAVLQNEALKASMGMMDQYSYRATLRGDKGYDTLRIVEAFERFDKGGESIGITLPPAS